MKENFQEPSQRIRAIIVLKTPVAFPRNQPRNISKVKGKNKPDRPVSDALSHKARTLLCVC